jgi:amino acid transporter
MVNMIIGGSILRLPSILAEKLGAWSPLSCLGAGAGMLVIAGCIAEVSSRYDETGGLYLYARNAFGRFAGLLVAWLTWLTRIAAPAAGANLFCTYAAQFVPYFGTRRGELLLLAALIGQLAVINYIGAKNWKKFEQRVHRSEGEYFAVFCGGRSAGAAVASGSSRASDISCDAI